jgi:hypothetical protein
LKTAFRLTSSLITWAFDHCTTEVTKDIILGRILALDETIVATESCVARKK